MRMSLKYPKLSWMALIFSLSIVIVTFSPTLFPALYSIVFYETLMDKIGIIDNVSTSYFETGYFFISVLVVNIIFFALLIIFKFKKPFIIPYYNISKRNGIFTMFVLLVIFSGLSYENITTADEHMDWIEVKRNIENWDPERLLTFEVHVRKLLLISSFEIFGNYSIIPFLASVVLLITMYSFTNKITNNRLAGLVSVGSMLQSNLFLSFSSIPTYTIFWVLFYLISTYAIVQKKWYILPISYVLAILSKPLVIVFLPLTIFFILNSKISNKIKFWITIIMSVIIGIGTYIILGDDSFQKFDGFNMDEFMIGFTAFSYQMRFDWLSVVFLLPIIIGLFLISKNNSHANSISIMISGILLSNPLLVGLMELTNQPYRFIPLVVFLAIAIGMIVGTIIENGKNSNTVVKKSKIKHV